MSKCVIDGKEVEFTSGQNLIEVARSAGIEIPNFCYHPGLSVVGQCRMCAVEIEKSPKLQTACSTPPQEGMVIKTKTEKVRQHQRSVMEFLLINHPLDCPVCDKAGEYDLQELSFRFGDANSRYSEERRTFMDLDMGSVIQKNMNRCIHCTRCIRFGDEVAGVREMVALRRGNNTEIGTIDGKPLQTEYAGNYADICPTGSLTSKDFRFKKRVWLLKKTESVCEGCSRGCSLEIDHDGSQIYRCVARANPAVNRYWICDEGRFNFHYLRSKDRVIQPQIREGLGFKAVEWAPAIVTAKEALKGKRVAILLGGDLTQEEATLLQLFAPDALPGATQFHYGTPGVVSSGDDVNADRILKRRSKTANLHGMEKLHIAGWKGLPGGVEALLVVRGGRAVLPDLTGVQKVVGIGVFQKEQLAPFDVVLPGAAYAEEDGTVVNFMGLQQDVRKAVPPPPGCKELTAILRDWVAVSGKAERK